MDVSLLATSFKYLGHPESKGAIFHGAVFADDGGLYLLHNRFTWESANTAGAAFGLLGVLIHWFFTRSKQPGYPLDCLAFGQLDPERRRILEVKGTKDDSKLSIIPKDSIEQFSSGLFKGTTFKIGSIELVLIGAKGKSIKALQEGGYEKS
jgi:hypothetical protein